MLSDIPLFGEPLFSQRWPAFLLYALVPLVWWIDAAQPVGARDALGGREPDGGRRHRHPRQPAAPSGAACRAALLAGLGGAYLAVGEVGTFNSNMTAGRGFIVIAAVIFGGWTLRGTVAGCFLFGGADAFRLALPALGYTLNPQLLIALAVPAAR